MKRLVVVAALAVAACGGGGGGWFDGDGLRSDLERRYPEAESEQIDAAVEAVRTACETEDDVFVLAVAMHVDDRADELLNNLKLGCPERTEAALDELGED